MALSRHLQRMTNLITMNNKDYFIQILRSTGREGVDEVIAGLESLGFFEAPASTVFHLNEPGGLLRHSEGNVSSSVGDQGG